MCRWTLEAVATRKHMQARHWISAFAGPKLRDLFVATQKYRATRSRFKIH